MQILFAALLISGVQLLLLWVCGVGLARLLLPPRLHQYETTLAPLFGLALLALVGYYGANTGLTMRHILPLVGMLAVILLVAALVGSQRAGRRLLPGMLPPREALVLVLMMGATWLLNIAPTLNYGTLMPIGDNWDIEFYLPLADYLKDYSYLTLAQAPPNPLRDLLLTERLMARAMGATYAQALADLLLYRDAWDTWVPMLALLRSLTLPGLYALLREGLGTRAAGAAAGTLLAGINSLLLWTTYNSFGMSTGGLALLPVALLLLLLALEAHNIRSILAATLLLGGLTCTYWPILMAYGTAGLGIGLALLWERRQSDWPMVLVRGVLVLFGGGVFSLLVHMRVADAFLGVFTTQTPSMGVFDFISPATIAGSSPFSHRGLDEHSSMATALQWGGILAALLLLLHGTWRGTTHRMLAAGMVVCLLAYLLGLRFVIGFPYGYLRGASYVNTLLLGIVGAGAFAWHAPPPTHPPHPISSIVTRAAPLAFVLLLLSTLAASSTTYGMYAQQPGVFGLDTAQIRAVAAALPRTGAVYISAAPELRGPYTGAWAYTLRKHELLGIMATGYHSLVNTMPGTAPAYHLLQRDEDPHTYGLRDADRLWQDNRAALYATPDTRRSWLSGRPTSYTEGRLLVPDTTYSRAQLGVGDYLEATPDKPLDLYASDEIFVVELPQSPRAGQGSLTLSMGSFNEQPIAMTIGSKQETLHMPAGMAVYRTGAVSTPLHLALRSEHGPLLLRWAALDSPASDSTATTPQLEQQDDTVLIGFDSEPRQAGASVAIQVANPGTHMLRLAVEIYEEVEGYHTEPAHYAWSLFPMPLGGSHHLEVDLTAPAMSFDGMPLDVQTGTKRDGDYFAALWVYQGEQVQATLPFLRFTQESGIVTSITPLRVNGSFVRLMAPEQPLDIIFGGSIGLRGFELDTRQVRAGNQVQASLLWYAHQKPPPEPLMVFVQVLDENDHKIAEWNGAIGGDWWPSPAWEEGQRIWQDIPLAIAPDAEPGMYRIIGGVFNPSTGANLLTQDGTTMIPLAEVEVTP